MKLIKLLLICLAPVTGMAQGVHFDTQLSSWKQVKEKAIKENKFIFVDYTATWCGPCKQMDSQVYPDKELGEFTSTKFIALKVQGDSTKSDSEYVRGWYADAKALAKQYKVTAFPTYLFFSPEGELVYRGVGFQKVPEFKDLLNKALTSKETKLLAEYKKGKLELKHLPEALTAAEVMGELTVQKSIGNDYVIKYLMKRPKAELYTKDNLVMLGQYVRVTNKATLKLLTQDSAAINKIVGDKFAQNSIMRSIKDDLIYSKLYVNGSSKEAVLIENPDWSDFYNKALEVTDANLAKQAILTSRITYNQKRKNWLEFGRALAELYDGYGFPTAGIDAMFKVNNLVFDKLFKNVDDRKVLTSAAEWMRVLVATEKSPGWKASYLDTYANVLYKLGEVSKAIELEKEAIALSKDPKTIKENQETLEKFIKGVPTWSVK